MDFVDTVAMIARTKAQIKELQDQMENLFSLLPQSQTAGAYPAGDYVLKVRDNYRFDADTAVRNLPAAKVKAISVSKPDSVMARRLLTGAEYERCQKKEGVIREVEAVTDEV